MTIKFPAQRRQPFIAEDSYNNTIAFFKNDLDIYEQTLERQRDLPLPRTTTLLLVAETAWNEFCLRYTGGEDLTTLATYLEVVVEKYESAALSMGEVPENKYRPVFMLEEMVDEYVDYLGILSVAILLHREDLIIRIHGLLEGTDYDGVDLLIEELLRFYIPDRPELDEWLWDKPYNLLVDAIDSNQQAAREKGMKKYVSKWYPSMKGKAAFWGKHEEIQANFFPYFGYWTFCAAAFTYLYGIDDVTYRSEVVYPKDLVDYARSMPRQPVHLKDGNEILRVAGGQTCPRAGNWFSPAKADSARHFDEGELMPSFAASEYGQTIWQWNSAT
jgi:hypothetical protein